MKIVLPLPPNMANKSWGHWSNKYREQQAYMATCGPLHEFDELSGWVRVMFRPRHPGRREHTVAITATIYNTRFNDQDNAMARLKWPVDWLKHKHLIWDDDPAHLVWTGVPTQVKCKRDERRVEFVLEAA